MVRLFIAASLALGVSIVSTSVLIRWLTARKIGQPIHSDVPAGHTIKAGTPTPGGGAIVFGALVGYVGSNLYQPTCGGSVYTRTGIFVMLAIVGAGIVGFIDDWIKVVNERNLGLNKRAKMLGLFSVALLLALGLAFRTHVSFTIGIARGANTGIELARWAWVIWAVLLITGFANAVNLTDGLDGLAAGASALGFSAYVVIGFWQFRYPDLYEINHALDLAVVAASMLGACVGFLWFNAAPAQIFMGDTGSLAIGTGFAALALATNTELLLLVVGALFVVETLSVMVQVLSFRVFKRRVFRMAPIHHHFELRGWPETRVIVRFWMMSGICTAMGLGLFYGDFLSTDTGQPDESVSTCDELAQSPDPGIRIGDREFDWAGLGSVGSTVSDRWATLDGGASEQA